MSLKLALNFRSPRLGLLSAGPTSIPTVHRRFLIESVFINNIFLFFSKRTKGCNLVQFVCKR